MALPVVGALMFVWWVNRRGSANPLFESSAVLPFQNLSGDPGQEYLSGGLTETLVAEIGKIRKIRVISRNSVMPYKNGKTSLPQIAQQLNAEAIIVGSVLGSSSAVAQ
jgi:TolB-like protein